MPRSSSWHGTLLTRTTHLDPLARVFIRIDNNPYTPNTSLNKEEQNGHVLTDDPNSIFADASEDYDDEAGNPVNGGL
ncbi:Hypothetical predicted protein, partial [Olea europaea subsp. europaea]